MYFGYFSRLISFSRTFQDSPVYSSTFQARANPARIALIMVINTAYTSSLWRTFLDNNSLDHGKVHLTNPIGVAFFMEILWQ